MNFASTFIPVVVLSEQCSSALHGNGEMVYIGVPLPHLMVFALKLDFNRV